MVLARKATTSMPIVRDYIPEVNTTSTLSLAGPLRPQDLNPLFGSSPPNMRIQAGQERTTSGISLLRRLHPSCRERWQVGAREDWRYADLRAKYPRSWWWLSFFAVYVIQVRLIFPDTPSRRLTNGALHSMLSCILRACGALSIAAFRYKYSRAYSKRVLGTKVAASGYLQRCVCREESSWHGVAACGCGGRR